jgi:hypothetical protein
MEKEYDFTVSFSYYESWMLKKAFVEIKAKNEAEALEKAKSEYSVHLEGKNYQTIECASIIKK